MPLLFEYTRHQAVPNATYGLAQSFVTPSPPYWWNAMRKSGQVTRFYCSLQRQVLTGFGENESAGSVLWQGLLCVASCCE